MNQDEAAARERFSDRYAIQRADVNLEVEREVIGGDWGANGYTTMQQADELGRLTGLGRDSRLLDVGAGRGWPGLYLAADTGANVVLTDLPLEGLQSARERAAAEGLTQRVQMVVASAARLPLRPRFFDAVVSTDVLC